jgi:hypothetical protein
MSSGIIAGNVASISVIDVSLTPAEVATITAPAQTFTVPGLLTTDAVLSVNPPGQTAGATIGSAYVSAADTLSIQFVNPTAGGVTPNAGTHRVTIARAEGNSRAGRVLK